MSDTRRVAGNLKNFSVDCGVVAHTRARESAPGQRSAAVPSTVHGTEHDDEEAGILRLDFKPKDADLEAVDWDAFFDKFESSKLAFLYQEKTASGKPSRFHKVCAARFKCVPA